MDYKILDNVEKARNDFNIKNFPGNFFDAITKYDDYIFKYKLALFKQDLGKDISGFISYTERGLGYICLNYKNTIGHQNFTLAHEIGHFYMHKGEKQDDDDKSLKMSDRDEREREANEFAAELLYPLKYVMEDIDYVYSNNLLSDENEIDFADFINDIAIKYCISFRFAILRILFNSDYSKNNCVLEKVDSVIDSVSPLGERYDKSFYKYIENHHYYKPYNGILKTQYKIGKYLADSDEMGYDSVNAIIDKSSELEGFDDTFI